MSTCVLWLYPGNIVCHFHPSNRELVQNFYLLFACDQGSMLKHVMLQEKMRDFVVVIKEEW